MYMLSRFWIHHADVICDFDRISFFSRLAMGEIKLVDLAGHESHPVQHKRKKKEIGNTRKYYQHVFLL